MGVKKVAVIGLGLLGASLCMALRGKQNVRRIGWARRPEIRHQALALDVADEAPETVEEAVADADLTVFALPIPRIVEFMEHYAACWKSGALVTDMGSVKGVIHAAAERFLVPRGVIFAGSHPMAGTEKSGFENAFPTLYQGADVFIVPSSNSGESHLKMLEEFWHSLSTRTVRTTPEEHDGLVAHTSHVLHIVASALSLTILSGADEREKALRFAGCATGFRDTSRIASSNPAMWREIIENNTPANLRALENFERELRHLREMIAAGDYDGFEREFARGKRLRDSWLDYKAQKS